MGMPDDSLCPDLRPAPHAGPRRRRWLTLAAVAVVLGVLVAGCGDDDDDGATGDDAPSDEEAAGDEGGEDEGPQVEAQELVTRPDLAPPVIDVVNADAPSEGFLFLGPKQAGAQHGPLIIDDAGEVVWNLPMEDMAAADFRVQTYQGEPVLTWYEGTSNDGHGQGEFVVMDSTYTEIARVTLTDGLDGDLHEFQLTDDGTALVLAYEPREADLTEVDGPEDGWVLDNHVQEIDIETGEVLFDWRALGNVPFTDSYRELVADAATNEDERDEDGSEELPMDWFHVNSVEDDGDAFLVSARNTHAVYRILKESGEIDWILNGKSSDFEMGEGTVFAWQHDARRQDDGTITILDNAANPPVADRSRGIRLDVDPDAGTATLVTEYAHPDDVLAGSQANMQVLDNGNVVIGWGSEGRVTEFTAEGEIVFDATWAPADSYRVYRMPWVGEPTDPPDVVAESAGDAVDVHVSWNGATEVASWRVLAGADEASLAEAGAADRDGFETTIAVPGAAVVQVEALDAAGAVIGTSDVVTVDG